MKTHRILDSLSSHARAFMAWHPSSFPLSYQQEGNLHHLTVEPWGQNEPDRQSWTRGIQYKRVMNANVRALLRRLEEQGLHHDASEPEHARRFLNLEPATAEVVA